MFIEFSLIVWSVLVSPKMDNIGFGSRGHVPKSENHKNEGFLGFHKINPKSD